MVLDPQDRYPLVGSAARVIDPKPKVKRKSANNIKEVKVGELDEKKQKLTFFDVSDGELSEASD